MSFLRRLRWWRARSMAPLRSRGDILGRLHDRFGPPEPIDLGELSLAEDLSGVAWIRNSLWPWSGPNLVGTVIPDSFPGYARVLHPASRADGSDVPWAEVARWSEQTLTGDSSFRNIAVRDDGETWRAVGEPPPTGEPDLPLLQRLATLLEPRPDECWFCVWDGWGYLDARHFAPSTARLRTESREYLCFRGPLRALGHPRVGPFHTIPSIWWPEDRAWCVATEIDAMSTYVGASPEAITRILADDVLEAFPATPTDPFDGGGDPRDP